MTIFGGKIKKSRNFPTLKKRRTIKYIAPSNITGARTLKRVLLP